MKLSEFRRIIDAFDDEARRAHEEDKEILLDIATDLDSEDNVDISDVYESKLSHGKIKLEPKRKLNKQAEAKKIIKDRDVVIDQTYYFCPNCERKIGKHDKFCKHCGQEIINIDDLERQEEQTRKERIAAKRAERKANRRGLFRRNK